MNEGRFLTCPNCGANITNTQNCEYCGSLLVRFVENNIPLDKSKYGDSAFRFAGLKEALKRNLEEQDRTGGRNHIRTVIECKDLGLDLAVTNPLSQTESACSLSILGDYVNLRSEPAMEFITNEKSLVVCIKFYEITSNKDLFVGSHNKINDFYAYQHKRFQQLDIYKLFTYHESALLVSSPGGIELECGVVHQYYLDFGRDIDGSAAIITQYILNGNEIKQNAELYKLNYNHISVTESQYQAEIAEIQKDSRRGKWIVFSFGLVCAVGGFIMLVVDGESALFQAIACICGGIWFAIKGLQAK